MKYTINATCGCNVGRIRTNNEDNFCFAGKTLPLQNMGMNFIHTQKTYSYLNPVFSVFDGMGGEECGEIASFLAAQTASVLEKQFAKSMSPKEFLEMLCAKANKAVWEKSAKLSFGMMGTTLATLMFTENSAFACNLGDSRIYLYRDNELLQLSRDHAENLPPDSKRKPRLTQHLGLPESEIKLEPYIEKTDVKKNDLFLICSDGLSDMVKNQEICEVLNNHVSLKKATEGLIKRALQNGGKDNVTVILCKID